MTEFVHKFLEWLEDAFVGEGRREGQVNPMEQLFYGQCQTVGMSEGVLLLPPAVHVCVCVCVRVCVCVGAHPYACVYACHSQSCQSVVTNGCVCRWFAHRTEVCKC